MDIGKHPLVCKLLKAVYNKRPPMAKYKTFWDAESVLKKLNEMGLNAELTLKQLTLKTVLILALASFARVSELASIDYRRLHYENGELCFNLLKPRKTQTSGALASFKLKPLLTDPLICPVETVRVYIERTEAIRAATANALFIEIRPPHASVGASTVARWLKLALKSAGVDIAVFAAHSTRGAAASKAFTSGVPCDIILAAASWKRASTFHRFYNKRIGAGGETGREL